MKEVHVRNDIPLETAQRVLSTKGKRRGKQGSLFSAGTGLGSGCAKSMISLPGVHRPGWGKN